VLVELGLVEQRYQAVLEVLVEGKTVSEVAVRFGVTRQSVHRWLRRYAAGGLGGLVDQSSKPVSCPHQMPVEVEAVIVELRGDHPGWGPRTIASRLARQGVDPVPGRSSIYRCLVRHGLIDPKARRRRRADYKRWERCRPMELWQMDVVGGVRLADGSKAKVITGVDDHSRFCVSAYVVPRATARPTCEALSLALRRYGVPDQILTDNGKVFTSRFGPRPGEVLFDRICRENGIKHLLTAPRSPTTTGKVERFHKTLRRDFLTGKVFADLAAAQAAIDGWVDHYNHERPHQGIGDVPPVERFRLAQPAMAPAAAGADGGPVTTRKVGVNGKVSFAGQPYPVPRWLAGETVEVNVEDGILSIVHREVLVATHVQRHRPDKEAAALARPPRRPRAMPHQATVGQAVTRKVDTTGSICFAGTSYRVGNTHRRRQVQVAIVGDVVEISSGGQIIRTHPIRHDRSRENGAFANPGGRPHRINAA
jgi:transposase InsO family protein